MSTTAGNFRTHLLTRLRTTGTVAISSAFSYEIINYCQTTLNVGRGFVLTSGTFTYTSGNALYTLSSAVASGCARLVSLYESSRTIRRIALHELKQYDREWYAAATASGTYYPLAWAPIGDEMIAIYPKPATGGTLSCAYIKNTALIDGTTDTLEVDDKDLHFLYDLCEIVSLAHLHKIPETRIKIARLRQKLGLTEAAVSRYVSGKRGTSEILDGEILKEIAKSVNQIVEGNGTSMIEETCRICRLLKASGTIEGISYPCI